MFLRYCLLVFSCGFLIVAVAGTEAIGRRLPSGEDGCSISEDPSEQITDCSKVISTKRKNTPVVAQAYHYRGQGYLRLGQFKKALADLNSAIKADPPADVGLITDRGVTHCQMRNYAMANADFAQALSGRKEEDSWRRYYAPAYFNRGICYLRQAQYDLAIKEFRTATDLSVYFARAYYGLYLAHQKNGNAKQAIDAYSVALRTNPKVAQNDSFDLSGASDYPTTKKKGGRRGAKCPSTITWDPVKSACLDHTGRVVTTHEISVFYGTDRKMISGTQRTSYGNDHAGAVAVGRAEVTVPVYRRLGQVERPWWIHSAALHLIGAGENPKRFYVIKSVTPFGDHREFAEDVRGEFTRKANYGESAQALVFIHGYNVTFDDALFRAAQITADTGFDGVSFVYSWPSAGELKPYQGDRNSAEQAARHLRTFLQVVTQRTNATKVHLIAHSMGSIVLLKALEIMALEITMLDKNPLYPNLGEIVFAAPDIESTDFQRIASKINRLGVGRTLYASINDLALRASMLGWGGSRAGFVSKEGPLVVPGIYTVDVSAVSTDILGHSTYASELELLIDIGLLFKLGLHPPPSRIPLLIMGGSAANRYWIWPQ